VIGTDRWRSEPPCVRKVRATWPNGEWGYSTRRHMLEPVRPEAVLPDRALCLPTFSHFLIVNKLLSLSNDAHPHKVKARARAHTRDQTRLEMSTSFSLSISLALSLSLLLPSPVAHHSPGNPHPPPHFDAAFAGSGVSVGRVGNSGMVGIAGICVI
jgi:hypothetical protein